MRVIRLLVVSLLCAATPAAAQMVCAGAACGGFNGQVTDLTFTSSSGTAQTKVTAPAANQFQLVDPAATTFERVIFGPNTLGGGMSLYMRTDLGALTVRSGDNAVIKNFGAVKFLLSNESYIQEESDGIMGYHLSNGWLMYTLGGGSAVASASSLPAPGASSYHVTGTTGFNNIVSTNRGKGYEVTLIFDGVLTVTTGTGNIRLAGAANFTTSADDTLTLVYDGTNWYEKCRSVN